MAKLTAKARKSIPSEKFALPAERKYPVEDRAHAANAKSRASQQEKAGNISPATESRIDRAANKVLHHPDSGGRKYQGDGSGHWSGR